MGYLSGQILWHLGVLLLMSKAFNFLRLFSGCFAMSDGKPCVRSSDQCMEILSVCQTVTWTQRNTTPVFSLPRNRNAWRPCWLQNFRFLPKNLSVLKWETATRYENWKKVTNFSSFPCKKILCAFHFRFLSLPVTSGYTTTPLLSLS